MKLYILLISLVLLLALALPGLNSQPETTQHAISQTTANVQTESVAEDTLQMAYSEAVGSDDSAYHFQRSSAGYTASNAAHNLTVEISGSVVKISSGDEFWQLISDTAAVDFIMDDNRLTLHRDGYDEWYVNGPVGLQQGFTLYEPSDIVFDVTGTLPTTASDQTLQIGDALTFSGLMAYDIDGASIPVAFELEDDKLVYTYDDTGADYPLTIDPWVQQAKLITYVDPNNWLGRALAVSGDTALVGARREDCAAGINCGSVYVFVRNGTTWNGQATLTATDADVSDEFGNAVALDGDTALIGAFHDDCVAGSDCGSAYVFTRSDSMWSQQAKLMASDRDVEDFFGNAVALDGDTVLIGAFHDDCVAGSDCGSAYVFTRSGSMWSQQAKLTAPDGFTQDYFAKSVALSGDTALLGAYWDDCPVTLTRRCGSAYVFVRSGTAWNLEAKLTAPDGVKDDYFGNAVAVSGDTALVAAVRDDDNGLGSGSAYVFVRSGTAWSQQAKLTAGRYSAFDYFGWSVALQDNTAIVGSILADLNGADAGSAIVFVRSGVTWGPPVILLASDGANGEHFGTSVAVSGNTVLVGAEFDDENGFNRGSAFVFLFQPEQPLAVSTTCNGPNLEVTITAGDAPFNITASAGINTPVNSVGIGTTTILGPEKWDDLTVTETTGDLQSINLGQFKCRTDERPVPLTPAHRSRTTDLFPVFSWTAINYASNYRVFVFDNKVVADRTVDIRQNSGGPTSMTLSTPLPDGRLFWRVRGRTNRVWSLWSVRFTLFKDPVAPIIANTPVPTIDLNSPSDDETEPTMMPTTGPAPTFPPPPNSR